MSSIMAGALGDEGQAIQLSVFDHDFHVGCGGCLGDADVGAAGASAYDSGEVECKALAKAVAGLVACA